MKRFTFLPMALMFLACSFALAQTDFTGYGDDEDAAFAELERETQGTEAPGAVATDSPSAIADDGNVQEASAPAGNSWEQPPQNMPAENSGYTADAPVKESSPVTEAPAKPKEKRVLLYNHQRQSQDHEQYRGRYHLQSAELQGETLFVF